MKKYSIFYIALGIVILIHTILTVFKIDTVGGIDRGHLMLYNFILLFLSLVIGSIAEGKGRSAIGFFFLSFLLSPIVGAIALTSPPKQSKRISEV